jgi:uncharacterized membrane protein YgaE (UPF0421/DUF939 family)
MSASLLTRTIDSSLVAVQRLRDVLWAITAASAAAGMAWYIAHDVFGHPDPFFAPIAAAVSVSASNVFQAQRAIENISGVALGICLGAAVQVLLGSEWIGMAVAVFVALCVAVLIGPLLFAQGLTLANQAASSAILVMALSSAGDRLFQRLQEALIGGGVALVLSILLFPANPLTALRDARIGVLGVLHDILAETADRVGGRAAATPGWQYSAVDRVHKRLDEFIEARTHARHLVVIAPRRWAARNTVGGADQQAAHVALLAGSLLHLARAATTAFAVSGQLPQPAHDAISELAAGLTLAEADPDAATAHTTAARGCAGALDSTARDTTDLALANVVQTCVDDLQQVIDLRQRTTHPFG